VRNPDHGSQLKKEGIEVMKKMKIGLQLVVKGIRLINNQLDKVIKAVEGSAVHGLSKKKAVSGKSAGKKTTAGKKSADPATAFDTVIQIISKNKQGIDTSKIREKTGFDDKKIANIIYKAKNRKLIRSTSKGIYVKA
jgi:hypothetical protein